MPNEGQIIFDGTADTNENYKHSDLIDCANGDVFTYTLYGYNSTRNIAYYNNNAFVSGISTSGQSSGEIVVPAGVNQVRFCSHNSVTNFNIGGPTLIGSKIDDLSTEVDDLSTEVDGLSTEVDGLSTEVDDLSTEVDNLVLNSFDPTDFTDVRNMLYQESGAILATYASRPLTDGRQKRMFTMAHMSDNHFNYPVFEYFNSYLQNHGVLDLGINTGDIIDHYASEEFNSFSSLINNGTKPFLITLGNHDTASGVTETDLYNKFISPIATTLTSFGAQLTQNSCSYTYVDSTYNIKFIVLNQFSNTSLGVTVSYRQDQIDWFIDELDDAISNNYYVVNVMHVSPSAPAQNTKAFYQETGGGSHLMSSVSGNVIGDIINAYKNGSNINQTYTQSTANSISINHTFASSGKFIAHLGGHFHCDRIGYLSDYPTQLSLIANCSIPNGYNLGDLSRQIGEEETENCFNLYAFDTDNDKVYVVRKGANINRDFKIRQREVYDIL